VKALHCLESGEKILEDASFNVVYAWLPVGGWWPLVEDPSRSGRGLLEGALEYLVGFPAFEDLSLDSWKIDVSGKRWKLVM